MTPAIKTGRDDSQGDGGKQRRTRPIDLLLIDDEQEFRRATTEALERRGFAVREADSGERGLQLIREALPEIVVLDLRMNGMDGIDTLTEIRASNEDLPVLILTGHGGFDDALAGIHLDIVDFVQKPIDVEALARRIRHLLQHGRRHPLRERTIEELMVPLWTYRRVYADDSLGRVAALLQHRLQSPTAEIERARRTILVFDRSEHFVGCIRTGDILALVVPSFLRDTPYATFFTGMVLAHCKLLGNHTAGDAVGEPITVGLHAPLMEAVQLMSCARLINIPVVDGGEVVGMLRDYDLLREVAGAIVWDGEPVGGDDDDVEAERRTGAGPGVTGTGS